MPTCGARIHQHSTLPRLMAPEDFYHNHRTGALDWCCKHCARVWQRLYRTHGKGRWAERVIDTAWQTYWSDLRRPRLSTNALTLMGIARRRNEGLPKTWYWCPKCEAAFRIPETWKHWKSIVYCPDHAREYTRLRMRKRRQRLRAQRQAA